MSTNRYTVKLTFVVKTKSVNDAYDIGLAAAEHLLDTYNDDYSISPLVRVEAEPETEH